MFRLKSDHTVGHVAVINFALFLVLLTAWAVHNGESSDPVTKPVAVPSSESVPFGEVIGVFDGVPAYSNGDSAHVSQESNWVEVPSSGAVRLQYTGIKWQCVEYVRRFWTLKRGVSFGDVDGAEDIFSLPPTSFTAVQRHREGSFSDLKIEKRRNGDGTNPIVLVDVGDLVVWPRQAFMPYGHVAVVVHVTCRTMLEAQQRCEEAWVDIAEQNYDARPLPQGAVYTRRLVHVASNHSLIDTDGFVVLGIVRSVLTNNTAK